MNRSNNEIKDILLISGSFTSANFYVMLSVIRSLGNVHIHAISANNEANVKLGGYDDVTYYHIYNWRLSFLKAVHNIPFMPIVRLIEYVFYRFFDVYDNYFTSRFERGIYKKSLEIIESEKIDTVFSVCRRFYTHRIALKITKKRDIKWFQFWVDPYSNRKESGFIWKRGALRTEKKFLEAASRIYALPEVFVNNENIVHFKDKLVTFEIPYLVNREVMATTKHIIFAGGFIKHVREPRPVLDILLSICESIDPEIQFHFYVQRKEELQSYSEKSHGKICFHDYVGHEALYKLLSNSFMLLNIGNAGSIQMPSKTVEYVSFRKPLLFFYKDKNDPSLRYLESYPDICRINVEDSIDINSKKLIDFFNMPHDSIEYKDLLKVEAYYNSTPDYIKTILNNI